MLCRRALFRFALGLASLAGPIARPARSRAQAPSAYLLVDAHGAERHGRPVAWGYVRNDYGQTALRVRLLVESVASDGRTTGETTVAIAGALAPGTRTYWETPVPGAGVSYRARVLEAEWLKGGP